MADDPTPPDPKPDDPTPPDPPPDDDDLEALKAQLRERNREAASLRTEVGRIKKERDELAERTQTEQEKAIAKARREAADEVRAEVAAELLEGDVLRLATGKLRNPQHAVRLLDLGELQAQERGPKRDEAITKALDGLIEDDDYLGVSANGDQPGARGVRSQGVRSGKRADEDAHDWLRKSAKR
jgi:hypothetical protein